ncbi:putative sulfate transporter YbaR [Clostridium polyendosporum]|uniref:Sulfate transporter YbaR n=1 Tax=Clostridium polyendosporum TaxID=69208 RepID=A0A919RWE8_9CLOT|nr:SulP family inorganic anion transporter [Clostridium polyendosporum]GIM27564.1 putative sulfate transporter YbaR [Clostridium polyendosporum]
MKQRLKQEWFANIRGDVLSGIVVALALIPEAIGFSIIAGVDPMIGLYASFCMAIIIAFVGGRPGMISAATGAMALVLTGLVKEHGIQYMFAATILTGIIQVLLSILKVGNLVKFIPRSVMIGFVNSLAILIFMAQLPAFSGESWPMYAMVIGGLAIIYLFPRITKAIPSPLVAIIVISSIAIFTGSDVKTVGDMGHISSTLPNFLIPNVPFNLETLLIILPYSVSLAFVGLIESLLTAQIVDDITETNSSKNVECCGQGIGNILVGFFGGMASCAMIGQSVINVKSGGRGRLSTFTAGSFLIVLIITLDKLVVKIPLAALVAVMIMVSIGTFDWQSLRKLHKSPKSDSLVMLITVAVVIATHNLAVGVLLGVVLSALFFASKISKVKVTSVVNEANKKKTYKVEGQLFFASVTDFIHAFNFNDEVELIEVDLSKTHIWDESGVGAIDKVVIKYHQNGIKTNLIGLNEASTTLIDRVAVFNKPGGLQQQSGH